MFNDSEVPMLSNSNPALSPPAANAPLRWSWIPTLTIVAIGRFVAAAVEGVTGPSGVPLSTDKRKGRGRHANALQDFTCPIPSGQIVGERTAGQTGIGCRNPAKAKGYIICEMEPMPRLRKVRGSWFLTQRILQRPNIGSGLRPELLNNVFVTHLVSKPFVFCDGSKIKPSDGRSEGSPPESIGTTDSARLETAMPLIASGFSIWETTARMAWQAASQTGSGSKSVQSGRDESAESIRSLGNNGSRIVEGEAFQIGGSHIKSKNQFVLRHRGT